MNYETFKTVGAAWEAECQKAGARLGAIAEELATRLGIPSKTGIGLTPDAIKFHPDYRAAKLAADKAFDCLRRFNANHAGRFKNEIRADIAARRRAKLQATTAEA